MLIYAQFGIIQNLQMSPISQTSFLVGTFFCRFLQQDSSNRPEDLMDFFNTSIFVLEL